jgi:hypothetical protein
MACQEQVGNCRVIKQETGLVVDSTISVMTTLFRFSFLFLSTRGGWKLAAHHLDRLSPSINMLLSRRCIETKIM